MLFVVSSLFSSHILKYSKYFIILLLLSENLYPVYRPVDVNTSGAKNLGLGGVAATVKNSPAAILYNPAMLGFSRPTFVVSPKTQVDRQLNLLKKQIDVISLPLLGYIFNFNAKTSMGFSLTLPYERKYPAGNQLVFYYAAAAISYKLSQRFSIGLSLGILTGAQNNTFFSIAPAFANGLYYKLFKRIKLGLGTFIAATHEFSPSYSGKDIRERMPTALFSGININFSKNTEIFIEVHYHDWNNIIFAEKIRTQYKSTKPRFAGENFSWNPHIGLKSKIPGLPGIDILTGFQTASYFASDGNNALQFNHSLGLSIRTGRWQWADGHFTFALSDGYLGSLYNTKNNVVEEIQLSLTIHPKESKKVKNIQKNAKKDKIKNSPDNRNAAEKPDIWESF